MIYDIPLENEPKFLQKISKYSIKSNGKVKAIPHDIIYKELDNGTKYACRQYDVSGIYKLDNWTFIGEIEHKDSGNVVRIIDDKHYSSQTIIDLYQNAPSKCDHCGTTRVRNNTFIVYNDKDNKFRQVGKQCLKDYTGFDAEMCALIMSFLKDVESFENFDFGGIGNSRLYFDKGDLQKIVYNEVANNGYDKDNSKHIVFKAYIDNETRKNICNSVKDSTIAEITSWLDNKTQKPSEYYSSCKTIWNSSEIEFRDFNYILSMVNVYFKEKNRLATQENIKSNEYVGNIGDKVKIIVKSYRVLFSRGPYATNGNVVDVYEIIDNNGHTYIWSTATFIQSGDVIDATIKDLKEYKGIKQTVITRGKIVGNFKKRFVEEIKEDKELENVWKDIELLFS